MLLNLLVAAAFQANAGVAGVEALPPEGVAMTVGMIASAAVLVGPRIFPTTPRRAAGDPTFDN
jgi:hypothetical protein